MKTYPIDAIRNIVLAGHGGTGKTSLVEALLYKSGVLSRLGSVDKGTSASDCDEDEIQRKMTINSALLPCEWKNKKLNFIDTPGYPDFVGDVIGAMRAVETAVIVVDGGGTIEVGTDTAWENAEAAGISKVFFVNKLEKENNDFYKTLEALRERYGTTVAPLWLPIGSEASFTGVVDLLTQKGYTWADGKVSPCDVPADMADAIEENREALIEAAAEMDDDLLEKFFADSTLSDEDLTKGLEIGIKSGKLVPVLCGSAAKLVGIDTLLDFAAGSLPSPKDAENVTGEDGTAVKPDDPFSALVFKTLADPYVGKLTFFRVFSGSVKADSRVFNVDKEREERFGQVYSTVIGKNQQVAEVIGAGDMGAVAKLQYTVTGDTLCDKAKQVKFAPIAFPDPVYSLAVGAKTKADEDKLGSALGKLAECDPTFRTVREKETSQTIMSGLGDTHLDIIVDRLKRKFGVEVETSTPKIAYRETITAKAEAQGRHKKQSGGRGQFGDCWIRIEPQERGAGYEYVDAIVGGAIPRQFIPSVDKGIREALNSGIQAGCPVVDVKVTCYDGSFHPVDSSDMAFQLAGKLAFQAAAMKARPVLLEPIMDVEIIVPDMYMGDVIGDLNTKRGRVGGMEPVGGGRQLVKAQVPMAEMQRYIIDLRSIARGRGRFSAKFSHYEEVPQNVAQEVIAEAAKAKES